MKRFKTASFACFLLVVGAEVAAAPVAELWARATPPGGTSGAIYGDITNEGETAVSLDRIELDNARHVMVHRTVEEDGMMRMKHASISLAPGESVSLMPGDLHIMVMGLGEPFKQGCSVSVTLGWSDGTQTSHSVSVGSFGQQSRPDEAESQPCN